MKHKLLSGKTYNPGSQQQITAEPHVENLKFNQHKFTRRTKPEDPRRILLIPSFGEFGCEIVSSMYIIPKLVQKFPGYYSIVMGWSGREYLYRHLVDEFWELSDEHQWLREYCRAFHHQSINLKRFEEGLKGKKGVLVTSDYMSRQALSNECHQCRSTWSDDKRSEKCKSCGSENIRRALFFDMPKCWENAYCPPIVSTEKMNWAREKLPENPVGIFARGRKCYGRNLPVEFYNSLIKRLKNLGYNPVWLGEPATTIPCPDDSVIDFSRMKEQKDLETTLAIISQLKFTIQFWTASTRLSAMAGTPYILFESPDQVWGQGQEGYRLELITRGGPRKLVACHYLSVMEDQNKGLDVLERSIMEVEQGNFEDSIGLVEEEDQVRSQMMRFHAKMGK